MSLRVVFPLVLVSISAIALSGCANSASNPSPSSPVATGNHTHEGWWCDEHGVPEEVCALCNIKLVADFKAKGDWCTQHDRPDSQCFTCHPEKQAEFAAQYEAKYGVKPSKTKKE